MNKLVDMLETKYIALHFNNELSDILEQCAGSTIDIADARFVPATARTLMNCAVQYNIKLVDTLRPEREEILRLNDENDKLREDESIREILPLPENMLEPAEYIKSLDKSKIYYVDLFCDKQAYIPLVTRLLMYVPILKIDVAKISKELSQFITQELYSSSFEEMIATCEDYLLFKDVEMYPVHIEEKDLDTQFYVFGIGYTTWNEVRSKYKLIPAYLGKLPIMKHNVYSKIWKRVDTECFRQMKVYNEIKNNTLYEFIRRR